MREFQRAITVVVIGAGDSQYCPAGAQGMLTTPRISATLQMKQCKFLHAR